ncbi:MAG: hypothetical protein OEX22_03270 [Cyclobacteriaceae bacterium]|nr:hypothetical protein [Cyclobacteriaceae bacterium]
MKVNRYLFITLLIVVCQTVLLASNQNSSQLSENDSLRIKNQVDSVFLLHEKNFNKAAEVSVNSIVMARQSNSKSLLKLALDRGAWLNWMNGDHFQAKEKCYESLSISTNLKDTIGIANVYSLLGLIYLYTSDYDSSLYHLDKALSYFVVLNDTVQVIRNNGFKGLVYNKQGDYLRAKENLLSTVLLKRKHLTPNWGVIDISNDVENARKYYVEALLESKKASLILEKETTPSLELRNSYHNVGLSYLKLNYPDSALIEFKKSAKIAEQINVDIFWNELSRAYSDLGLYDSAIWCNKNSIENSLDHGTRIHLANGYFILGNSYSSKGDYYLAIEAYKKSLALNTLMEHKYTQMNLMVHLSNVLLKTNKYKRALHYTNSAIELAQLIGTKKGLEQALNSRFNVLKAMGNYKEALEVKILQEILLDSLQQGKVQLDLAKLDLYNDVELSKLKISELRKEHELSKSKLRNKNLIMVIVLVIGFFTILLLLLNYFKTMKLVKFNTKLNNQQSVIRKQNNELTISNREKELLLGEIHHRVKNNLQTISSLLNLQQRKLKDPESIKVFEDSKSRVIAMGLIHQHLYQNTSFIDIDFKSYTKELVQVLVRTNANRRIDVKCSIPALEINLDNAIFFGLIIHELALNCIKHAYDGVDNPILEISIFDSGEQTTLLVRDNGKAENTDIEKSNSFGWKMINTICNKLEGQLSVTISDGLSIKVVFKKEVIALK